MSITVKGWNYSKYQMPPDRAPVWITKCADAEVFSATFRKGERIDPGAECFSWHIEKHNFSSQEHWYWQHREASPPSLRSINQVIGPEVRGGVYEANKAVWLWSANKTPFEFGQLFWVHREDLGVRLATLVRLEYGGEKHGQPVFQLLNEGEVLYGRRYYMPLLYPTKPT